MPINLTSQYISGHDPDLSRNLAVDRGQAPSAVRDLKANRVRRAAPNPKADRGKGFFLLNCICINLNFIILKFIGL